jgi:glutathione S-transferase
MPTITAFENSPDGGEGHARDMRVRWALEEVGQPYDVRLVPFEALKAPAHRAVHPFGKIPTYEDGDIVLFESGAIVLHLAETRPGLMPADPTARERAIVWLFAALNTVEPPIIEREAAMILDKDKRWYTERMSLLDDAVRERLSEVAAYLGERDWLEGEFTAGDLMMVMVLRRLEDGPKLLEEFPTLLAYVARGEARPAYRRSFADQKAVFAKHGR